MNKEDRTQGRTVGLHSQVTVLLHSVSSTYYCNVEIFSFSDADALAAAAIMRIHGNCACANFLAKK